MKPNELDSAIGLIKAGRFRKALDELSSLSNRVPQHDQALVNVLEAEVLQETGDTDRAMAIAKTTLRSSHIDHVKIRCLAVIGLALADQGDPKSALSYIERALSLSVRCDDLEQMCRIRIRLIGSFSDDPSKVSVVLRDLKRDLARHPKPQLLAQLHIGLARAEALRGSHAVAWSHLRRAHSLLELTPNASLQASLSLQACGLASVTSQIRRGLVYATEARTHAKTSGAPTQSWLPRATRTPSWPSLGNFSPRKRNCARAWL